MSIRFEPNCYSIEFFELIGWYIKERKLTAVDLATKMNKSKGWWRVHLHYEKPLNARQLDQLCEVLSVIQADRKRLHYLAARGLGYKVEQLG